MIVENINEYINIKEKYESNDNPFQEIQMSVIEEIIVNKE